MKIICDTTFLDGRDRFEAGDVRTVSDADGARFIKAKWAHAAGEAAEPLPSINPVNLDVQSAAHKLEASNG